MSLYKVVFEQFTDALLLTRCKGEILDANPAAGRLFGLDPQTLVGRPLDSFVTLSDTDAALGHITRAETSTAVTLHQTAIPLPEGGATLYRLTPCDDRPAAQPGSGSQQMSREQFALESSRDGLWDWDLQTGETYFSPRWKQMLDYEDHEIENNYHAWEALIHPDDLASVLRHLDDYLSGRVSTYRVEHRLRCKNGNYKWILARGRTRTSAESGRPARMLGTHTDITELRETVHALQESESRFRALIEDLDVGVVLQDCEDRILISNRAAQQILGLPTDDLAGISSDDPRWRLAHPDGSPLQPSDVPSVVAARTGQAVKNVILGSTNIGTGERRWLQVSATPRMDASGRLRHTLVTIIDITSTRRTEMALRESETKERQLNERFALAAESAGIGVWSYDPARDHLEWDETMHAIFRSSPGDDTGTRELFEARIHPDDRERVMRETRSAAAHAGSHEFEFRIVWPDEEIRHIRSYGRRTEDDPGTERIVVGISYDVTSRRKLEEQLRHAQKMEAVGQLAGGVAHDFNNLLTVINGYCEVLLMDTLRPGDPAWAAVEAIHQAGERAAMLTRQLLLFSRKVPLAREVLDLPALVRDSARLLRRIIPENIQIDVTDCSGARYVNADRTQLEQVVMNLALNARDAMESGGHLQIAVQSQEFTEASPRLPAGRAPGTYAQLTVRDTGCGIAPDHLARLFEPFFTTKPMGKGTGLGLATVYGVVEESGGFLTVESVLEEGTCFQVFLPEIEPPTHPSNEIIAAPPRLRGHERILLVEDEESVRNVTRKALAMHGYQVEAAADGAEALKLFEESRGFDLLITDLVMPEMGGRELASLLLHRAPELRVLLVSGYEPHNPEDEISRSESPLFLQKPYRIATLLGKVREALQH